MRRRRQPARPLMEPLSVQVITYAPTVFSHCQHCELAFQEMGIGERLRRQEAAEALPDELIRDYQALSDWVHELLQKHGPRVRVTVVDAASIEGVLRSLRYGVRRYPAVIVDGREKRIGTDFGSLDPLIERHLAAARPSGGRTARSVEEVPTETRQAKV